MLPAQPALTEGLKTAKLSRTTPTTAHPPTNTTSIGPRRMADTVKIKSDAYPALSPSIARRHHPSHPQPFPLNGNTRSPATVSAWGNTRLDRQPFLLVRNQPQPSPVAGNNRPTPQPFPPVGNTRHRPATVSAERKSFPPVGNTRPDRQPFPLSGNRFRLPETPGPRRATVSAERRSIPLAGNTRARTPTVSAGRKHAVLTENRVRWAEFIPLAGNTQPNRQRFPLDGNLLRLPETRGPHREPFPLSGNRFRLSETPSPTGNGFRWTEIFSAGRKHAVPTGNRFRLSETPSPTGNGFRWTEIFSACRKHAVPDPQPLPLSGNRFRLSETPSPTGNCFR
jgi:hypothetical protein